jgi:hypothetical protein
VKKNRNYRQGIYSPINKEKYKGTFPIIYRSSLELRFMKWVDANPSVLTWGSESIVIPYQNPLTGRVSRYFTDFNIVMKDKQGDFKKFLIEIKPYSQTLPPVQKNKKTKSLIYQQAEYVKNQAKWQSAVEYCSKKNMSFVILTEKHLGS